MKSRDRRAERMSEFVTNMFQYNVTVGITRSEIIFFVHFGALQQHSARAFGLRLACAGPKVPTPDKSHNDRIEIAPVVTKIMPTLLAMECIVTQLQPAFCM